MKKQVKSNLFTAIIGLSLSGAFLMSAADNSTKAAAVQVPVAQEQPSPSPAAEPVAAEPAKLPFGFFLSLVTTFTNGGSIDFDLVGEEGQSFFWNEMPWDKEQ